MIFYNGTDEVLTAVF